MPGFTIGNKVTESATDLESVQHTLERIMKTIAEFREADMWKKIKDHYKDESL